MIRVLFVCLGNICRSPMAEAVFRHLVDRRGLSAQIEVDSAGTALWHIGKQPHKGTRDKLDEVGISYEGMTARQVLQKDFQSFHYIVTMDDDNMNTIESEYEIPGTVIVKKLLDYIDHSEETNVPDPYYTGDFDYTYALVQEACEQLLQKIVAKYELKV